MKVLLAGSELCRNLGDEARSGGVVCRRFEDFDAVFESGTCDNLGQVICAFQGAVRWAQPGVALSVALHPPHCDLRRTR
jgi:hypothetical protein